MNSSNKIYHVAKECFQPESKPSQFIQESLLSNLIAEALSQKNEKALQEAFNIASDKKEVEIFNTILREVKNTIGTREIRTTAIGQKVSKLLLLPIIISANPKSLISLPNNKTISEILNHNFNFHFLFKKYNCSLSLLPGLFSEPEMQSINLQDWWEIHTSIIENNESEFHLQFTKNQGNLTLADKHTLLFGILHLTYLIPHGIKSDNSYFNCQYDINTLLTDIGWEKRITGNQIANTKNPIGGNYNFNIVFSPPSDIETVFFLGKKLLEKEQLITFLEQLPSQRTELLLAPVEVSDFPEQYVVFSVGAEDRLMNGFYVFDMQGDFKDLFTIVNHYGIEYNMPIFLSEKPIMVEELDAFLKLPTSIDMNDIFSQSHHLDMMDMFLTLFGYKKYHYLIN